MKERILQFIQPIAKFGKGRKTILIPKKYVNRVNTGTPFLITIERIK